MWIHERKDWPDFRWNTEKLAELLASVRYRQGGLIGQMKGLGFRLQQEAVLETLTKDVLKTSEIEGEKLDAEQVRSSVARRLGMDIGGLKPADRNVEGVVEMMLDATGGYDRPLTDERLFGWHASLFPTGRSGMTKIKTGAWRDESAGPMQVVSGAVGKEKVHFEAPKADRLEREMTAFLKWFEAKDAIDPVLKAGLAHLWFVTIHPFEDGNGRTARAVADTALARSEHSSQRFYSMSGTDQAGAQRVLRHPGKHAERHHGRDCLDALVPGLPGPRYRRRACHVEGRAEQSAIPGSHQICAAQRPAAIRDQPPAGRVRGQAHEFEVREADEVLAGHRLSRYSGAGRASCPRSKSRGGTQHELFARAIAVVTRLKHPAIPTRLEAGARRSRSAEPGDAAARWRHPTREEQASHRARCRPLRRDRR
jgi:hypothetical protein